MSISRKTVMNIFLFLFVLFTIFAGLFTDNVIFWSRYIFGALILGIEIWLEGSKMKINKYNAFFLTVFLLGTVTAKLNNQNIEWDYLIIQAIYMGAAVCIVKNEISIRIAEALLWILHALFAIAFLGSGFFPEMFSNVSTNYVSVYYIVAFAIYELLNVEHKFKLNKLHIILAVLFAIMAGGRGGIISLAIIFLYDILSESKKNKGVIIGIIGALVCLIILVECGRLDSILFRFVERGLDSSGRVKFWVNYLKDCSVSVTSFVFGANILKSLSRYYYYIPHLHNSFLTLYGYIGLFPALYFLYIMASTISKTWTNGYKRLAVIFLAFMIRAFTDIVFCLFIGDLILYCMVFFRNGKLEKE